MTNKEKSDIKKLLKTEYKNLVQSTIESELKKQFKGKEFDDLVKDKMSKMLLSFFKNIWSKSSVWKNSF